MLGLINMPLRISLQNRRRALRLYLEGHPQVEVADRIGVAQSTVNNEIRKFITITEASSLEEETGKGYAQILKDFDEKTKRLKGLEEQISTLRSEIRGLEERRSSLGEQG